MAFAAGSENGFAGFREVVATTGSARPKRKRAEKATLVKSIAPLRHLTIKSSAIFAPFGGKGTNAGTDATNYPVVEAIVNRNDSSVLSRRRHYYMPLCIQDEMEMKQLLGHMTFANAPDSGSRFADGITTAAAQFIYGAAGATTASAQEGAGSNLGVWIEKYRKTCYIKNQSARTLTLFMYEVRCKATSPITADVGLRNTANEPIVNASRVPLYNETYANRTDIRCSLADVDNQEFPFCTSNAAYGTTVDTAVNAPFLDGGTGHTRMWLHNLLCNDESTWVAASVRPQAPYAFEDLMINQGDVDQNKQMHGRTLDSYDFETDPRFENVYYGKGKYFNENFEIVRRKKVIIPPGKAISYWMELNPGMYRRNVWDPVNFVCRKGFRGLVVRAEGPSYKQVGASAARQTVTAANIRLPLSLTCDYKFEIKARPLQWLTPSTSRSFTYNSAVGAGAAGDRDLEGFDVDDAAGEEMKVP